LPSQIKTFRANKETVKAIEGIKKKRNTRTNSDAVRYAIDYVYDNIDEFIEFVHNEGKRKHDN
jgi:hypothetical protein